MSPAALAGPGSDPPTPFPAAVAIVPARLGSTRLPRKMLLDATGLPLFAHTVQNAERCRAFERVVLAADDDEIVRRAEDLGIDTVATDPAHQSGTDRVGEALAILEEREGPRWEVVVGVQGDEPELSPLDLEDLVARFADEEVEAATLWSPLPAARADDPSAVKLVSDRRGRALYFSRAAVPALGHGGEPCERKLHVGVYAFRPTALRDFLALRTSELERSERLEQLRWLEAGREMHVVRARHAGAGIDTEPDYRAFVERTRARDRRS
ncbi:MAG: 3-deoxy-manno-octulosonate cytidylyltransferase [Planctomycetota bacterium]